MLPEYSLFSLIVHFSNSPVSLIVYPDLLNPLSKNLICKHVCIYGQHVPV